MAIIRSEFFVLCCLLREDKKILKEEEDMVHNQLSDYLLSDNSEKDEAIKRIALQACGSDLLFNINT